VIEKIGWLRMLKVLYFFFGSNQSFVYLWLLFDVQKIPNKLLAVKRVIVRTLKLLFWGLLLQG
jgi:heparan-alpha-glucosaminide N-acetyltransferase